MVLVYSLFVVFPRVCCVHVLWSVCASFRFDNRLSNVDMVGCLALIVMCCLCLFLAVPWADLLTVFI